MGHTSLRPEIDCLDLPDMVDLLTDHIAQFEAARAAEGGPTPRADIDPVSAEAAGITVQPWPIEPAGETRRRAPAIETALGRSAEVTCRLCLKPRLRTADDRGDTYDPRTCEHRHEPWHRRTATA